MSTQAKTTMSAGKSLATGLLRLFIILVIWGGLLFGISGDWTWWTAWGFMSAYLATSIITLFLIGPELRAERATTLKKEVRSWDKVIALLAFIGQFGTLIIAALDKRLDWFVWELNPFWQWMGLALAAASLLIGVWAMVTNRHFEASVRIQTEREHTVVTGGPYRYVRHPSYVGFILFGLLTPLVLGSLCAFGPALLLAATITARTALEDHTLREELDGYEAYAQQTRFRLIPGLW